MKAKGKTSWGIFSSGAVYLFAIAFRIFSYPEFFYSFYRNAFYSVLSSVVFQGVYLYAHLSPTHTRTHRPPFSLTCLSHPSVPASLTLTCFQSHIHPRYLLIDAQEPPWEMGAAE